MSAALHEAKKPSTKSGRLCGAEGDRTPDLVNAIHALSQLSYSPAHLAMGDGSAPIIKLNLQI
jgi:hypothetical protein